MNWKKLWYSKSIFKNGDMVVMEKVKKQAATPMLGGGLNLPDFSKIKIPGASGGGGGSSSAQGK